MGDLAQAGWLTQAILSRRSPRLARIGGCRALMYLVLAIALLGLVADFVAELTSELDTELHIAVGVSLAALCFLVIAIIAEELLLARIQLAAGPPVEQLSQEKELAEAANAVKSRYLANVSHEIRSPLNAIYGYAQLVERDDRVSAREAARVIRRSAEHLTSLVDGLLDISQIDNGVMRVKTDVVQFRDFLDQIFWMLRPSAQAKGLEFIADFPARLPEYVHMDQSRLRQVLINLISNAIKFTKTGLVRFKVTYSAQIAVFEIVDTGPGIALEEQQRIFEPFERGTGANGKLNRGVGLGLSISKAIVEILGGHIELESKPGMGSCFRVSLMLGHSVGRFLEAQPARNIVGYEGARCSILVVDDDVQQLSVVRTLLETLGFVVAAVPNGETAIALSQGGRFDLAVLDITLPGLSGWDTASQLRERLGQDLRIIMLSANAREFHRPETERAVHDLFLVKPFEFGALLEAIGGLLELSWRLDLQESETPEAAVPETIRGLPGAALTHVERIRELLRIGHIRAIEAEITGLGEAAPEAGELVRYLYDCLDRFDLSAMAKRLGGI